MNKENAKQNIASGMSSTIGAAVGVVAGTMASNEMHAAESDEATVTDATPAEETADEDVPVVDVDPAQAPAAEPAGEEVVAEPVAGPTAQPATDPATPQAQPAGQTTGDVQVLDYQTITGADGQQMDAALVNISGNQALIVDADRDGVADALVADANNNGQIDNDEVVDISMHQLSMSDLQAAANPDPAADPNVMAQNAYNSDYENNANVDDYMA